MAAKVKISGDTRDAQQKVQRLRKEVERLDREAKKPKKITVQGNNRLGGVGKSSGGGIGGMLGVAGGNLIAMLIQGMMQYIPAVARVGGGLLGKAFGLKELENAVTKVTPKIRNLTAAIEVLGQPSVTALERADKLDALDDERRSHNSQSLAEEFAFSEAFSNVAGVNGSQIVDRLQAVLDMATSGNVSEMEKAWGQLSGFGVTYDDIQNGSTWQVLTKMLAAYNAAGADGENELEPALQQIVGKRQMAAIRKIGDGSEMFAQAGRLAEEFNRVITNQGGILEQAARSEEIRSQARIQQHYVPQEGEHFITEEANTQLSLEKLKTGLIGNTDTATQAITDLGNELYNDIEPAITEIGDKISEAIREAFTPSFDLFGSNDTTTGDASIYAENATVDVAPADPLAVYPPTSIESQQLTLMNTSPATIPNFNSSNPTLLADADITSGLKPNSTLPETATTTVKTAMGELTSTNTELKNTMNELTRSIKDNSTATTRAAEVMGRIGAGVGVTADGISRFQ